MRSTDHTPATARPRHRLPGVAALVAGLLALTACTVAGHESTAALTAAPTSTATQKLSRSDALLFSGATGTTPPEALAILDKLPVKGRAPKTGYARNQFGDNWTDDVDVAGGHNGCDTRNDILGRDLTDPAFKPDTHDCVVLSGTLNDPYTGKTIEFVRGPGTSNAVQIDHVVALADAWQKGAQQLTPRERANLANDPRNLLAVDGPTNQQKGAGDAATWLPPNKDFRCTYVTKQIEVKSAYSLWVTQAEKDAMTRVLNACTP
ncbi:HNH endonuclease family protein [Nocardia sp. CDC160]|uniref:HNH endonuclease family protein n=1 Tax=Nocardia sp. CDC160 TaxID=3112166 RepID=UPI002DBA4CD5|nr:HNH endonuclease family protein [Nocardia sp. CDC160]MEC3915848.1 HNH endonuclease family protein [Nocardia sp. CDC160]